MSKITAYSFEDHGKCNASYFQGVGTSNTSWDDVYLGCGFSQFEGADDALTQLCEANDIEDYQNKLPAMEAYIETFAETDTVCKDCDFADNGESPDLCDACENYWYVALYVRREDHQE